MISYLQFYNTLKFYNFTTNEQYYPLLQNTLYNTLQTKE